MDVVIADRRIDRRTIADDPVERMGAGNAERITYSAADSP